MRNIPKIVLGGLAMFALMAFTTISRSFNNQTITTLKVKPVEIITPEIDLKPIAVGVEIKGHDAFLKAIGHRESGNRYEVVNSFGYMGRYQFGKSTLKGLGIKVTKEEFLNNPHIQEEAMQKLLLHNRKKLHKLIQNYDGEVVHGILVTESGILAAAHLAGAGNVKKFFRKGHEFKDGYGTKMTSYITQFNGYYLDL